MSFLGEQRDLGTIPAGMTGWQREAEASFATTLPMEAPLP
jgi:hypothetical protein